MWLPESIYEKIPQFWFLAGLFFIFVGLYLGFAFEPTVWYIGLGIMCCLAGVAIFSVRQRYRQKSPSANQSIEVDS